MRAWVLRLVFLSAFSSRLGAELDHLVGLHFHGELELEHSASGQYVRHSQHVARASVRVWAVRGCAAAAYLREHVLGDLDDVLGQDLGIDVRNGPTFGRLSQKTILRSYFSQTAAMTSCDLKSFMLRVDVQHIGNANLRAAFEHFLEAYRNDHDAQLAGLLGEFLICAAARRVRA